MLLSMSTIDSNNMQLSLAISRIVLYFVSSLLSLPSLYILLCHTTLHRNFRAILLLMTLGGHVITALTAFQFIAVFIINYDLSQAEQNVLSTFLLLAACFFVLGSLFLTVERWAAIQFVSTYEQHASSYCSLFLFIISTALSSAIVTVVGQFVWPPLSVYVFAISGVIAGIICIFLRCKKSSLVSDFSSSLQTRYQSKENRRTTPVYFAISLNELATEISIGMVYLLVDRHNLDTIVDGLAGHLIHLISAYRILFVHGAIVYYYLREKQKQRESRAAVAHCSSSHPMDEHFHHLDLMWK